jgi:hypothetical protein
MKASRRLAENDIITRGVIVKIQQVAVCGNYENPTPQQDVSIPVPNAESTRLTAYHQPSTVTDQSTFNLTNPVSLEHKRTEGYVSYLQCKYSKSKSNVFLMTSLQGA